MCTAIESAIQPLLHSPLLPEILDAEAEVVEQYLRRDDRFYLAIKSGSGEIAGPTVPGFRISIRALFHAADNLAALRQLMTS